MKTIYKYPLDITDEQNVYMPEGAKILTAQLQDKELQLWALVDNSAPLVPRMILIRATGKPAEICGKYISTIQINNGTLVFHVFEA